MRQIDLQEYCPSEPHPLSVTERDALREVLPSLTIEPAMGTEDAYQLKPGSTVGAVEVGDLSMLIRPKIGISQLLSLACYSMGVYRFQEERLFDFREETTLPDMLALALVAAAQRAFARGLLHGYRTEEEMLYTVRGRIRFDEQIQRRFGVPLPVEVQYDEFTDDILANRLVKAAVVRLGDMRLHSQKARRGLGRVAAMLDNVTLVEFPPNAVPEVRFDRLNEHYRDVVMLSRLILRHSAFEADRGGVRASGFLMDMNVVFQEFVTVALRESLEVSERTFCSDRELTRGRRIYLDKAGDVNLEPDLSWWDGGACRFVGDVKYKNVTGEHVPNADLYQLLAYVTALDLPSGILIYAQGEVEPVTYKIMHSGKRLEVVALDLSGTLDKILTRIDDIARRVRALRDEAYRSRHAA